MINRYNVGKMVNEIDQPQVALKKTNELKTTNITNLETKNEPIIKSKFTKAMLGFAKGFTVGYLPTADILNPAHPYYERIVLGTAVVTGLVGIAREFLYCEEKRKKDNEAFLKTAVPTFIVTYPVIGVGFFYESLFISSVAGFISVIKRRIKEKKENKSV